MGQALFWVQRRQRWEKEKDFSRTVLSWFSSTCLVFFALPLVASLEWLDVHMCSNRGMLYPVLLPGRTEDPAVMSAVNIEPPTASSEGSAWAELPCSSSCLFCGSRFSDQGQVWRFGCSGLREKVQDESENLHTQAIRDTIQDSEAKLKRLPLAQMGQFDYQ